MSDKNKKTPGRESSPIKGLFKPDNIDIQDTGEEKDPRENAEGSYDTVNEETSSVGTGSAPEDEDQFEEAEEVSAVKGGFRAFLRRIVDVITAPEESELMTGDDSGFEDIFSKDKAAKAEEKTAGTTAPKKTYGVSRLYSPKKQIKEKEHIEDEDVQVFYSEKEQETSAPEVKKTKAEKTAPAVKEADTVPAEIVSEENAKEKPAEDVTAEKKELPAEKPVPSRKGNKTEISVEDIMNIKNSAPGQVAFVKQEVQEENDGSISIPMVGARNKKQNPAKKRSVSAPAARQEAAAVTEKPAASAPEIRPEVKNELAHDAVEKPKAEKAEVKNELAHDAVEKPKTERTEAKNELAHDAVEKPKAERTEAKNELAHDAVEKPKAERTEAKNELAHDAVKKPRPAATDVKNELSHDGAGKSATVKAEVKTGIPNNKQKSAEDKNIRAGGKEATSRTREDSRNSGREPMIYRTSYALPFVVMAGKFSKTLRTEYENTRRIREQMKPPEDPGKPDPEKAEKPEEPAAQALPRPPARKKKAPADPADDEKIKDIREAEPQKEKKKLSERFAGIFSGEGQEFEEEEEEPEKKQELDDYGSEEDADAIRGDIIDNFRKVFVRTVVLTATCVASVSAAFMAQVTPWIFDQALTNGWLVYSIISFLLFAVSVFVGRYPIVNGLMPLRHFKANSDTPVSVASLAVGVQSVASLFQPHVFLNGTYHIYVPLLILSLLLNSFGKLLIIKRTANNFRFLIRKDARFAGKIYTDPDNANKFVTGLSSRKPLIAFTKRSDFMSNFLQLSYAADPIEELAARLSPVAAILSLICGVLYGILNKDFVGGLSSFALTTCITMPMCALIAINIPMSSLCSGAVKKGSMIVGYEAVKQFCDTNVLMFDSSQLYPKGSIILSGMKTFNEKSLNDALIAGAAVTFAVNGSLSYVFEGIIQDRKSILPEVDSVTYDDEMGLTGWIKGQRVLIGNRALLSKHNIKLPDEALENKYRKMGNEIAYITFAGELVAMFVLTYKANRTIAQSLRTLEDSGVSFVVRTIDPNITVKHISDKFSLYPRCIKILPTGLGNIAYEEISGKEKTSRAYLVTNGKLSSFAHAVAGCIRIRSTVTIAKIIQYLSIAIGFLLVNIISFISGFAKLGSLEMLLYIGFWCIAMVIVSFFARKLS